MNGPSSDASGRYIPYWFRDGATISVTALVDYETPGTGDYYLLPATAAFPKATEDIVRRVEAIQADTSGAIAAISRIDEVISRISDYQTTIASAVEEQTATTNEMSRSVSEAAQGTGSIAGSITTISSVSTETGADAAQTRVAVEGLAEVTGGLSRLVGQFKV